MKFNRIKEDTELDAVVFQVNKTNNHSRVEQGHARENLNLMKIIMNQCIFAKVI